MIRKTTPEIIGKIMPFLSPLMTNGSPGPFEKVVEVHLQVGQTVEEARDKENPKTSLEPSHFPFFLYLWWTSESDPEYGQNDFAVVWEYSLNDGPWQDLPSPPSGDANPSDRDDLYEVTGVSFGKHQYRARVIRKDAGDVFHTTNVCTIWVVKVVGLDTDPPGKNAACKNETVRFKVTTNPSGHYGGIVWTVDGVTQEPIGGETLDKSWNSLGTKTVTATCCGSSARKIVEIIQQLTIVPKKAYVLVGGKKDFEAWTRVGNSAQNVTNDADTSFSTDKGQMNGNELTASESPSTSEGANWVRATYNGETSDAALTVIRINLLSPTDGAEFHMVMSGPTMPDVELQGDTDPDLTGLEYRFEVGDEATGRALKYEDAPSGYGHPSIIDSGWIGSATWGIDFGSSIYGGHVTTVKVSVRKDDIEEVSDTISRDFYILGDALTSPVRNAYIDSLTSFDATIRTMAKAIAMKESAGTHYWDGGAIGTAFHVRYPIREIGGDGYGVMMLTDTDFLNIDTIWNWKENINEAMKYIERCYDASVAHLNTHPAGVDDIMIRLGAYSRYNGGLGDRYWWWSNGPETNNGVEEGWTKFGYLNSGSGWPAYRDYNNDLEADPDENPYNIPDGPSGPNVLADRAAKYADVVYALE